MQMQLQFERQRREVHAHRNRRLLGTLRSTREEEEKQSTLVSKFLKFTNMKRIILNKYFFIG